MHLHEAVHVLEVDMLRYKWLVLISLLVLALLADALPITGELSVIPRERQQTSASKIHFLLITWRIISSRIIINTFSRKVI